MAKAKTKSPAPRKARSDTTKLPQEDPHQKAALRSEAFARAIADAKSHAHDRDRLRVLFTHAAAKVATIPKEPFKQNWPYLHTMLRLIRAYSREAYPIAVDESLLWIIAALNYLVDPFDLIPDEVPFLGFVDDATVVDFAVSRARHTLDDFMVWETTTL